MAIGHKERIKEGQKPKPTRTFSKKQETDIATATGGQRTPNSGATTWSKGDVLTEQFLLEAKTITDYNNFLVISPKLFFLPLRIIPMTHYSELCNRRLLRRSIVTGHHIGL